MNIKQVQINSVTRPASPLHDKHENGCQLTASNCHKTQSQLSSPTLYLSGHAVSQIKKHLVLVVIH